MNQESGWKVELLRSKIDGAILAAQILTSDGETIVARNILGYDSETVLSRARVMAVAPEMARFVKRVLWAFEISAAEKGEECQCGICRDARALLAQIKGEEATK